MVDRIFDEILRSRGLVGEFRKAFLNPKYESSHDPFLLPDMKQAIERLILARQNQEKITIYGDYDIDGLTATALLIDSLRCFGFEKVDAFIPNRFVEGYGLTVEAIERIASSGAKLIITVDCGSLSEKEIVRASELGIDVIVTDHHNVAPVQPPAVAVINPKRLLQDYPDRYKNFLLKSSPPVSDEKLYPFLDLAGVGVAFKLVQALQTRLEGLPAGHEKWLLDFVALGTVCDVVTLRDENRMFVYWGLEVMKRTRRPGLRALMAVAGVEQQSLNARSLGFMLGPRMNAAGRLETARYALELLLADEPTKALEKARQLDDMNRLRRQEQDAILEQAIVQAHQYKNDPVLVLSGEGWNHGIVGIVAARVLEIFKKPTFVLEEMGPDSKGSARSFGDFSAADAIRAADDIITKGGGHKLAAGVSLPTKNIDIFRRRINEHYHSQKLFNQELFLLPSADTTISFEHISEELMALLDTLEPFGNGNPQPVIRTENTLVMNKRAMGSDSQHVKLSLRDENGATLDLLAFQAPKHFFVEPGDRVTVWYQPNINEWNGQRRVEGRLLHMEIN